MIKQLAILALSFAALSPLGTAHAANPPASRPSQSEERQVDALFAKWNRPGMPGAVVEVIRDGKVVLRKAYGMADLERSVPMSAETEFVIGSMSKQFTAFAIHLLAQDGKLRLDDDIRSYLPEVPDFGQKITVRHLLHHTSGLRDYFNLMMMTGKRLDDVFTEDEAMALVARQRALNFSPGEEWLYCNTGYLLLARIVQRISGKPLPEFVRERIFEPLGMTNTVYQGDYGRLVPGRALSYEASGTGGYRYVAVGESTIGAGGVISTLADLARWDQNFYDGRVGGKALIAQMLEPGILNSGDALTYASGLVVDHYRGARVTEHGGAIGGYRTEFSRFPDQHFSVVVLANASDIWAGQFTRAIADVYLDRDLAAKPAAHKAPPKAFKEIALDPAKLDALVGYFALTPQYGIAFTKENGQLMAQPTGQPKIPAFAYGERDFFAKSVDAQFSFDAPGKDGIVAGGVLHQDGHDVRATRTVRAVATADDLTRFEGAFYSVELGVLYTVASQDGRLVLRYAHGAFPFAYNDQGQFATGSPLGEITYQCDAQAGCTGFMANNGRVRKLQFTRVSLAALSSSSPLR